DAPLGDLLGDDSEFQDVERQAKTAVLLWDSACEVAVLEEQLLPIEGLLARPLSSATGFRRQVAVLGDERAHLALQRLIVLRIGQLHAASSIARRSAIRSRDDDALFARDQDRAVYLARRVSALNASGARPILTRCARRLHGRSFP